MEYISSYGEPEVILQIQKGKCKASTIQYYIQENANILCTQKMMLKMYKITHYKSARMHINVLAGNPELAWHIFDFTKFTFAFLSLYSCNTAPGSKKKTLH